MAVVDFRPVQRRRFAGEEKWFELFEKVGPLEFARAFIEAGESATQMSTVSLWLDGQMKDVRLFTFETATNCRKVLGRHSLAEIAKRAIPGQFNSEAA
jgi:hypothetical protein